MKELYIVPLCLGHIIRDKSVFVYLSETGEKLSFPIIAWFIGGAEEKILVDTGTSSPEETAAFHRPLSQTPEQTLLATLGRLGLKPDDIDIVINTHLHWDHCYNNYLFRRAKFYVQREELRYAAAPLPVHAFGYDSQNIGMKPPFCNVPYEFVQGDMEIVPGVSVVYTPGHTPGSQGVLVKSTNGKVFLAGDTIPLFENWDGTPDYPYPRPSGVYTNLEDYYKTFIKIANIAKEVDIILPGHDSLVFEKEKYP